MLVPRWVLVSTMYSYANMRDTYVPPYVGNSRRQIGHTVVFTAFCPRGGLIVVKPASDKETED